MQYGGTGINRNFRNVAKTWLEVGNIKGLSDSFTAASSLYDNFIKPHVFISVMFDGDDQLVGEGNFQACSRLRGIQQTPGAGVNGVVNFELKIVQPNDSWCNYTWWTPTVEKSMDLFYMILEEGHYFIEGAEFDIGSTLIDTHCRQDFHRYIFIKDFAKNSYPSVLAHHQTYNDARFVSFRTLDYNLNSHAVSLFILLHNFDTKWRPRTGDCIDFHWNDHYDNNYWRQAYTMGPEKVSVLGYLPYHSGNCSLCEGIAFEAHEVDGITSDPRWIPFIWDYKEPPGVFGMFNSYFGGDTITVRSFNHSNIGVGVIAREDQCSKQSIIHIEGEKIRVFVVGPNNWNFVSDFNTSLWHFDNANSSKCCFSQLLSHGPTALPTTVPTTVPTSPDPCFTNLGGSLGCSNTGASANVQILNQLSLTNCQQQCKTMGCTYITYYDPGQSDTGNCILYANKDDCGTQVSTPSTTLWEINQQCRPTAAPTAPPIFVPTESPTELPTSLVPTATPTVPPTSLVPTAIPTSSPIVTNPCFLKTTDMRCSGTAKSISDDLTITDCLAKCQASQTCTTAQYVPATTSASSVCILFDSCPNPVSSPGTDLYTYNCRPTAKPTMAPVYPKICLKIMLLDKNNDNWGSLRLVITNSYHTYKSYAPTCESNPYYIKHCFDLGAGREMDYALIMVHGYKPAWYDEVMWQVQNPYDGSVHTGNYETVMKFVVGKTEEGPTKFAVILSDESMNVQPNQPDCESLQIDSGNGNGGMCKQATKPASDAPKVQTKNPESKSTATKTKISEVETTEPEPDTPVSPGGDYDKQAGRPKKDDDADGDNFAPVPGYSDKSQGGPVSPGETLGAVGGVTSAPVQSPKPTPKIRRSRKLGSGNDLGMDGYNGTWHTADGLGATWAIADQSGYTYYYLGSYCSSGFADDDGLCVDLLPGCYSFKVTGYFATNKDAIKWDYCGVNGGVMSELPFCIDENYKCKPGTLVESKCVAVDSAVYMVQADEVTLSGSFDLGGMEQPNLSDADQQVVQRAMDQELSNVPEASRGMQMTLQFSPAPTAVPFPGLPQRGLASGGDVALSRVSFVVRMSTGSHSLDTRADLRSSLTAYLSRSMSSGLFAARVAQVAHSSDAKNLQRVSFARLVELSVLHETELNERVSSSANVVVIAGAILGVAFGFLLFRKIRTGDSRYQGRMLLPTETI